MIKQVLPGSGPLMRFVVTAATFDQAMDRAVEIAGRFYGELHATVEMVHATPETVLMTGEILSWHCEFQA